MSLIPVNVDTRVIVPDGEPPTAIKEVVVAMKECGLEARHDKQSWGDWIVFARMETVVSIDSTRGLARSATIEEVEGEDEVLAKIMATFRQLGWEGEDEEGRFRL